MMLQMPTPSGVLVYDGAPHTDDWYAVRRRGITATDLPLILGLTKYGNALSVWRDKRGERVDEAGEAAYWGTVQEPIVAERWSDLNQTAVDKVGVLANSNNPWMVASLDRLVTTCPDGSGSEGRRCGLEIKTRNAYVAGKWRDEVPDDALAQVQWQLMVTGLHHMHVACLIGGQRLQQYTVARDKQLEDYLMAAALPVWHAVHGGVPPDVTADEEGVLLRELNKMFADREGAIVVNETMADEYSSLYLEGHKQEGRGKRIKEVAKGNMVKMLGGAEVATDEDNNPLWTYKRPEATDTMTADNLKRLNTEQSTLYASLVAGGYITKTKPNPKFNLK